MHLKMSSRFQCGNESKHDAGIHPGPASNVLQMICKCLLYSVTSYLNLQNFKQNITLKTCNENISVHRKKGAYIKCKTCRISLLLFTFRSDNIRNTVNMKVAWLSQDINGQYSVECTGTTDVCFHFLLEGIWCFYIFWWYVYVFPFIIH